MNRDIQTKEYKFDEKRHLHELLVDGEWKALTGCTTVLSVLNKPALIQWSANMAIEYILGVAHLMSKGETEDTNSYQVLGSQLKEAKTAHRKKKEKAGDWGTDIHSQIEKLIIEAIEHEDGFIPNPEVSDNASINHFTKWAVDNKVRFLESEKCMYSRKLFIGGICDILCEIDGKLWMADIKTGSGICYEAFWQMAGYTLMMEEMGYPNIVGTIVLNLKKDGTFEEKRSASLEDAKKGFLACLEIYRL